jgi:type III restriction enzyme
MLVCKVKARNELEDLTIKAKAAAAKWCTTQHDGGAKPWTYLLIPMIKHGATPPWMA